MQLLDIGWYVLKPLDGGRHIIGWYVLKPLDGGRHITPFIGDDKIGYCDILIYILVCLWDSVGIFKTNLEIM